MAHSSPSNRKIEIPSLRKTKQPVWPACSWTDSREFSWTELLNRSIWRFCWKLRLRWFFASERSFFEHLTWRTYVRHFKGRKNMSELNGWRKKRRVVPESSLEMVICQPDGSTTTKITFKRKSMIISPSWFVRTFLPKNRPSPGPIPTPPRISAQGQGHVAAGVPPTSGQRPVKFAMMRGIDVAVVSMVVSGSLKRW